MKRTFMKSKIHRAVVTEANVNYMGSITLDQDLIDAACVLPYERIEIYNVTQGTRLATYIIAGPRGAGDCCLNGAAAHLVNPGDRVILCTYAELDEQEMRDHEPVCVFVGEDNTQFEVRRQENAFQTA